MDNRYIIINDNKIIVVEKTLTSIIKRIYNFNNLPCIKYDSFIIKDIDLKIEKCNKMQVIENNIIFYNHNIIKHDTIILKEKNKDKNYIMIEFDNDNLFINIYTKNIKYILFKNEIKAELIPYECILVSDNKNFILLSNFLTY